MSSRDYNYDEQGQFFPYFIFTITALITLPLSYSLLKPTDEIENTAPRIKSDFRPSDADLIDGQKRKQWRRERRLKRIITAAAGYITMAAMLYLIKVTTAETPEIWDPYSILGISMSSGENQIKKRYRDLSKTLHPDKAVPDVSKNETLDSINDHWVEVSKAFKALTDEEIRNNYIQYGHPDGKQGFSIGIALPKFIVNEGSGKYVLLVYGLLLGVLLPYTVGRWWYGTQKMTKEKVLLASASKLFKEYKDDMTDGDVINVLSSAQEFEDVLRGNRADAGLGKVEQTIKGAVKGSATNGLSAKDQEKVSTYDGPRRKAAALLWSYIGRLQLGPSLDDGSFEALDHCVLFDACLEKYEIGPLAHKLLDCFVAITLAYGNTAPLLSAYRSSQHLIQAVPPSGSPLQQLPHITPELAHTIEAPLGRTHFTVQQFMSLPEHKRRRLCTEQSPRLSMTEYNSTLSVARQLPFLSVEKAFFKVMGEKFITPGSLVQFVVKARIIPPGTSNVPEVSPTDLEDIDPEEGDLDALLGRRSATRGAKMQSAAAPSTSESVIPPVAYAPYFPRDHSPRWHVFLADSKMGKIAVPPFTVTTFNRPIFDEKTGLPTFELQTFKFQFQSPQQAGSYQFVMHVVCDSYIGSDHVQNLTLNVEAAEKAAEMANEDDEISEPEEDSIAGQLRAVQSGNLSSAPPKRKKKIEIEEDSDDSSGTDEEQSDMSDTDTDTDSE
ncbi:uncharacterized protein KY384_006504 [Bacidia gigantensis]|uniref:uncharacterized protein n=1 Tax=Bacidia gigantensis TaxID=2732470 RepID=UPI001D0560E2|nr:uncharacterized protein KY384_006504 [Bacidia gigantensis]KAG8528815.1 hypothetical protein KY384_006504 [Bacidia gigantensis]